MSAHADSQRQVRFGEFQLDFQTAELRNNGNKYTLQGQSLQILAVLLERPGQLVTREELKKKLWPEDTFVDFDQGLNKAVNRLREALDDSADQPRFIQTLPRRGYRFIGSVEPVNGSAPARDVQNQIADAGEARHAQKDEVSRPAMTAYYAVMLALAMMLLVVLAMVKRLPRPIPVPRVVSSTRITNDGWRKYALVSDGVRLYFSERGTIVQSSTEGGEVSELHTGLRNIDIYDISPGGGELLVADGVQASETDERPIWAVSLPAGTPRRIGAIKGLWACWHPDGQHVAFASRTAIFLAKKDGTEVRKIGDVPAVPWKLQFSPDGKRLRFDGYDAARNVDTIWEMNLDDQELSSVFPRWYTPLHTGNWTADGKYFFFNSHDPAKDRDEDVWVLPEPGAQKIGKSTPVQLTKGPLAFGYPFSSGNGKRLFVLGTQSRAELSRYDPRRKQFVPYLGGISSSEAEVSRDRQWVAYVSYPDLTLWRSRLDGTERVQLTFLPMEVVGPRWSPDGSHIAFTNVQAGKVWKIYIIPAQGGAPREMLPDDTVAEIGASWWPDGKSIVFGRSYLSGYGGIQRVDLETQRVSTVPGSEKMFSPSLSPDGQKLAAFLENGRKLLVQDFREGKWHEVAHGIFQFNTWSRDSENIYMLDMSRDEIVRFNVGRARIDTAAVLKDMEQGSRGWIGLAGDDSPLVVRDKSVTDVYRLDVQLP